MPFSIVLESTVRNLGIVIVVNETLTFVVCALADLHLPTRAVDGLESAGLTLVFVQEGWPLSLRQVSI